MAVLYFVLRTFAHFRRLYEARLLRENTPAANPVLTLYSPLLVLVITFVGLLVVALTYWPIPAQRHETPGEDAQDNNFFKAGFLVGGGTFLIALPFFSQDTSLAELVLAIHYCRTCMSLFLSMALMAFGLPVIIEIVFRGIVFETLRHHTNLVTSILVSSFLSAVFWPVFFWPVSLIFGVASCLTYRRRQSLIPCIVANVTISTLSVLLYIYIAVSTR